MENDTVMDLPQKKKYRHSLKTEIILGCVLCIVILSVSLSVIGYYIFKNSMMEQYRSRLTDVICLTQSHIDIEDIRHCMETGEETDDYRAFIAFLDDIRRNFSLDQLVLSTPVKDGDSYDVILAASGLLPEERNGQNLQAFDVPKLGDRIGKFFPPEVLPYIYDEFIRTEDIRFTVIETEFGQDYRGGITIRDENDEPVVMLTAGLSLDSIKDNLKSYVTAMVLITCILCLVFIIGTTLWMQFRILRPISIIEKVASEFEEKSRTEMNPGVLVLDIPDIKTGDELESLADTISEMSFRMKSYVDMLLQSETRMTSLEHDLDESRKKAMQLGEMATKDPLTGIRNRSAYDVEVEKTKNELRTENKRIGVAMIDLLHLKNINDTYGREKGNAAIIKLCRMVCVTFSHSPVFRIDGDEFVVIIKGSDYENATGLISLFKEEISRLASDQTLDPWERISASIGYALSGEEDSRDYDELFRLADERMFLNKNGKDH